MKIISDFRVKINVIWGVDSLEQWSKCQNGAGVGFGHIT